MARSAVVDCDFLDMDWDASGRTASVLVFLVNCDTDLGDIRPSKLAGWLLPLVTVLSYAELLAIEVAMGMATTLAMGVALAWAGP